MLRPSAVVELIWQDETGSTSAVTLSTSSSLTVAEIATNAEAFVAILAPLTDCVFIGYRIKYKTAFEVAPAATGDAPITHVGALFFSGDGGDVAGSVLIPAFKDAALLSAGPMAGAGIDLSNSDVSALVSAVLDAGICNPFAVPFVDVLEGYIQSRL